jgi:hypothetical protein
VTAQGEDILAWLENAITRVETVAHSAAHAVGGPSWDGSERDVSARASGDTVADGVTYGDMWEPMKQEACDHIALNDPESVLRRCAADRKLLELHQPMDNEAEMAVYCTECDVSGNYPYYPCPTLRALAEGYGWTGGER